MLEIDFREGLFVPWASISCNCDFSSEINLWSRFWIPPQIVWWIRVRQIKNLGAVTTTGIEMTKTTLTSWWGSLGAGSYQQSLLPTANMADGDLDTERYSLFIQILSTHSRVLDLPKYTTEWHVCIYWTPPFDSHVRTFTARWWGKRQAGGNSQLVITIISYCKSASARLFTNGGPICNSSQALVLAADVLALSWDIEGFTVTETGI